MTIVTAIVTGVVTLVSMAESCAENDPRLDYDDEEDSHGGGDRCRRAPDMLC